MPLINKSESNLEKLKGIKVNSKLLSEIKDYCTHFEVSLEDFAAAPAEITELAK